MSFRLTVAEFIQAAARPGSVDPRNPYVAFGLLWGVGGDFLLFGQPLALVDSGQPVALLGMLPEALLAGAVLPVLLAWVFGAMGVIRWEKAERNRRTIADLDELVAQRTEQLRRTVVQTVLALSASIEAKDAYTHGHCLRVWGFSRIIALRMGATEAELQRLQFASYLHDIGKIHVPDQILGKPGRLTEPEYQEVKGHPAAGEAILAPIEDFREVSALVRCHHERFDGRGYPDGLEGEAIPLLGRVLAVADSLDAMTSNRAYRRGLSLRTALAELRRCASLDFDPDEVPGRTEPERQFDPRIVEVLCQVDREELMAVVRGEDIPAGVLLAA